MNSERDRIIARGNEKYREQQQTIPDYLLTKKELAKRLRISERKIEMDGNIPQIRWGRSIRYDWVEVLEYLRTNNERGQE